MLLLLVRNLIVLTVLIDTLREMLAYLRGDGPSDDSAAVASLI